jgi:hypothetical protein
MSRELHSLGQVYLEGFVLYLVTVERAQFFRSGLPGEVRSLPCDCRESSIHYVRSTWRSPLGLSRALFLSSVLYSWSGLAGGLIL